MMLRRGRVLAAGAVRRGARARSWCAAPVARRHFATESRDDGAGPPSALAPSTATDGVLEGAIPGTEHGGRRLAIIFTCTVCDTRSAKKFAKQSYDHGVVVVKCPGCGNHHLIADNLGFFEDDRWDVEKLMAERGDDVHRVDDDNILGGIPPERLQELIVGTKVPKAS